MTHTAHRRVILDMDSSESPVHGGQEGASYNGHFGSTCYHPLFVFNQFGDCEGAMLRAGNVHSAHRWRDVLDPILSRYRRSCGDTFARTPRLPSRTSMGTWRSGDVLLRNTAPRATKCCNGRSPLCSGGRWAGRRSVQLILYDDFWYRAGSWDRARRVVAKVEWHQGRAVPSGGLHRHERLAPKEWCDSDWIRAELDSAVPSVRGHLCSS